MCEKTTQIYIFKDLFMRESVSTCEWGVGREGQKEKI